MIKSRHLFLLSLMPFPLLSTEFLDFPISCCLLLILLIGTFSKKGYYLTLPLSALVIYFLKTTFGSLYQPEPMITFLALASVHRILYPKIANDKASRIIAFLWIASFSLLKTDLLYFIIMIYSMSLIFATLDKNDDTRIHPLRFIEIKSFGSRETIICFFLIVLLFVFFPRFNNFFPKRNSMIQGKIGYSKTIDNSQILNLQNSSQNAFTAETNQVLNSNSLYWRGRIHSKTDGFNWSESSLKLGKTKVILKKPVLYKIKYEQDLGQDIILLDSPYKIEGSNTRYYKDKTRNMYKFYNKARKSIVDGVSSLNGHLVELTQKNKLQYLQLPGFIPKSLKSIIEENHLKSKTLQQVLAFTRGYLIKEKYSYSLSPGDVTSLSKFIDVKKGYCTHFSSFLGIMLRYLGFQTRLVSGFQGGIYNDLGGYYTISSNDAHAWVEVLQDGRWLRVDPTSYIDPARINLGGQTYFNSSVEDRTFRRTQTSNFLDQLKNTWGYLNYKLGLYMDNYDISQQDKISSYFKLTRNKFFVIGLFSCLILLIIYFFFPKIKPKSPKNKIDLIFKEFIKKHNQNNQNIKNVDSLETIKTKLKHSKKSQEILYIYEQLKYAGIDQDSEILRLKALVKDKTTYL